MKRELELRHRLQTLDALAEAVAAMKSMSASQFRRSRQALPDSRAYRDQVLLAMREIGVPWSPTPAAELGLLLVVSDLGLCGNYNSALVEQLVSVRQHHSGSPVYSVGRRPRALMARNGIQPRRWYQASTSLEGLPGLLLQLAQDLLEDFVRQVIGGVLVVSARFQGVGRFEAAVTPLLPLPPPEAIRSPRPARYQDPHRLASVAVREYLYGTLHEIFLDAMAAEHAMRLVASESAEHWLDETRRSARRKLAAQAREVTTQEVLDVIAGSRSVRSPRHGLDGEILERHAKEKREDVVQNPEPGVSR